MKKMFIILFLGLSSSIYAQEAQNDGSHECGGLSVVQKVYTISFGEKIQGGVSGDTDLSVTWNVSPQNGVKNTSGTGMETGDIVFNQPGIYQIQFNIPAHGNNPAKVETSTVEVSNVRMVFDMKNVKFSKELTVGSTSGIEMKVPVNVQLYNAKEVSYSMRDVSTTGVSNVTTHLKEGKTLLKEGKNELTFELSGTISQTGNIQFRVYDTKGEATFFNKSIN